MAAHTRVETHCRNMRMALLIRWRKQVIQVSKVCVAVAQATRAPSCGGGSGLQRQRHGPAAANHMGQPR
jgi:hypothetical protein